jgi:transposase
VLRDALHAIPRVPRGQAVASDGRLVTWATDSAGKRYGTAGPKMGHASLKWAVAEAAVVCLRSHAAGQTDLARLEQTPGQGKALTVLAHQLARAVYYRRKRRPAFDMQTFLQGSRSGAAEPDVSLDHHGRRLRRVRC